MFGEIIPPKAAKTLFFEITESLETSTSKLGEDLFLGIVDFYLKKSVCNL